MNIIVNADQNWGIGSKAKLLFPLSQDLKHFKALTTGKIVVMGRRTLQSLPDGKPLPNRINVVLSRKKAFKIKDAVIFSSPEGLGRAVRNGFFKPYTGNDFFVIGGEQIYHLFLPFCNTAYVTRVEAVSSSADTFFPNLDKNPDWQVIEVSDKMIEGDLTFRFFTYQRIKNTTKVKLFT